jgi:hypothetical protein
MADLSDASVLESPSPATGVPSYLVAADNHNLAAGTDTILDYAKFIGGAAVGAIAGQAAIPIPIVGAAIGAIIGGETARSNGAFMAASLTSGAASFYNTGVEISNWLGSDATKLDVEAKLSEYDSDLAAYYRNNAASADLAGFLAGSLIPVTGSLKVYNYGAAALNSAKAGKLGTNFSEATGLLIPLQNKYLDLAIKDLGAANVFNLNNANVLRAFAAGVGEEAIQGAIASTAVLASMHASPIMEEMDVSDMSWNILGGALVQGTLGGALRGVQTFGKLKKGALEIKQDVRSQVFVTELTSNAPTSYKILNWLDNKLNAPAIEGENLELKLAERTKTSRMLDDRITQATHELGANDTALTIQVANMIIGMPDVETAASKLVGLQRVSRVNQVTEEEKQLAAAAIKNAKKGKATPEESELIAGSAVKYIELHGENAGAVSTDLPAILSLADKLKPGQEIKVTEKGVFAGDQKFYINSSSKAAWDMVGKSADEIEARRIWFTHPSGAKLAEGAEVHATDIPALEHLYLREVKSPKIILQDGSKYTPASSEELLDFIQGQKMGVVHRLRAASDDLQIASDPAAVELKLKQLLGVHFKLSRSGDPGHDPNAYAWTFRGTSNKMEEIRLNAEHIRGTPFAKIAHSIKHEQGHNQWNLISDIMPDVTPDNLMRHPRGAELMQELVAVSKKARPESWKANPNSPYLNSVHELMADMFGYFSLRPAELAKSKAINEVFGPHVRNVQASPEAIDAILLKARKLSNNEIANMVNIKVGYLEQTAVDSVNPLNDIFAMQMDAKNYTGRMITLGRHSPASGVIPTYLEPRYAKMIVSTSPVRDLDGNVLEGMSIIKQQQRLNQVAADNAVVAVIGDKEFSKLPLFSDRDVYNTNAFGDSQSVLSSANGEYGSTGSYVQQIGAALKRIKAVFHDESTAQLNPGLYALRSDSAAAVEMSALMTRIRATPEAYYHDYEAKQLVLRGIKLNEEAVAAGKKATVYERLDPNAPERISIQSDAANEFIATHIARNGERVSNSNLLAGANGHGASKDPRAFYPIPRNTKDYPYFAFVVDPQITGSGHVSMIYGATEKELDALIANVQSTTPFQVTAKNTQLRTITKAEAERYHKALGDYSREDTISENTINTALFRKGVSSDYVPTTNPTKIAEDFLNWHLEKDTQLAQYAIATKYSKVFAELKTLGESATNVATSKVNSASLSRWVEGQVKNPYVDYIKTALDITSLNQMPRWTAINNFADTTLTEVWNTVSALWRNSKSPADLDQINSIFSTAGLKSAYYDAALAAHANHAAPKGVLTTFVARANAILATMQLRLDPMNAYNNTVGSVMLTGAEGASVLQKIASNSSASETLNAIGKIRVPGTDDLILSPTKLYANAIKLATTDPATKKWLADSGFLTRRIAEHEAILDSLTLTGSESARDLDTKLSQAYALVMKAGDIGEKLTGNKLAEEFNRGVSAVYMKQLTDIAVAHDLMPAQNAYSYINTFVNRTQGNYIASQRPLLFQGPLGSALGLFQTYQFNVAQQLLRHVADGNAKTAALALGLQSTIYGLHGLPGFDAINAHIIGNASGNKNHRDLYDATYGAAGKEGGDWLMYGAASNIFGMISPDLKANIYSRGDINPRFYTVIPTNVADLPIVNASARLYSSLKEGITKLAGGGNAWPTMLQAIEHAGINRPLAGLAQTLEAVGNPLMQSYSTSTKGNVIAANDLWSLANLTRIAGAKPLDEAIAVDAGYRLDAYKSKDIAKRQELGEIIKTTVLAGNTPSEEQVSNFAAAYARSGGKQEGFNQFFMEVMKRANTSQVNEIANHLKSPQAQSMQKILGGYELKDFR